jgi:hypothetical protein
VKIRAVGPEFRAARQKDTTKLVFTLLYFDERARRRRNAVDLLIVVTAGW